MPCQDDQMRPANSARKVIAMHENTPSLLASVQQHAAAWFASLGSRQVRATLTADQLRQRLGGPLPIDGTDPEAITDLLAAAGVHGTVASAGPRYFGFVDRKSTRLNSSHLGISYAV